MYCMLYTYDMYSTLLARGVHWYDWRNKTWAYVDFAEVLY
jgi:hypothetical protein